jgi:hypothetical protein
MSGGRSFSPLEAAGWIALVIYLVLVVGFAWNPTPFAQALAALGIAIACTHAVFFMAGGMRWFYWRSVSP